MNLAVLFRLFKMGGRRSLVLLLSLASLAAILEGVGVGSVMPFIATALDPGVVDQSTTLSSLEDWTKLSRTHFIVALGLVFLVITVSVNVVGALMTMMLAWYQAKLIHILASTLFEKQLARPYSDFLESNTAELSSLVLSYSSRVAEGVVVPILTLVTKGLSGFLILAVIVWVNPLVALIVMAVLVPFYSIVYFFIREKLNVLGAEIAESNRDCYRLVDEGLSGVKDLQILDRTLDVSNRFSLAIDLFVKSLAHAAVLSKIPKYLIEVLGICLVVGVILWNLLGSNEAKTAIALAALYAYAGYRLLPIAQSIFTSVSFVRYNQVTVEAVINELDREVGVQQFYHVESKDDGLKIDQNIVLRDIGFSYAGSTTKTLDAVSIEVPCGHHIGIVGPSGSGKSTLLDILAGLVTPESGQLLVDGENVREWPDSQWRRKLGYVPQVVFLADADVLENIAFGLAPEDIDQEKVKSAAKIAQIHDFLEALPDGYKTNIGQRGVKLSGGQRQRLGIARALYHRPEILILDEATNSLDTATENSFMDTVTELAGKISIVSVAHRLRTVRACQTIYILEGGRLLDSGSYEELIERSATFRQLV